MSDSQPTPAGAGEPSHIGRADTGPADNDAARTDPGHTDDPEILELLSFEPVPRMFKRKDGWTPALQRKFIVLLARTGSPTAATEALGKNRYGVEKLYKAAGAAGFRAAWDAAIELFEERAAERLQAEHSQGAGERPPFFDRRRKAGAWAGAPEPGAEPEISDDQKWELIQSIGTRFMRKVAAERRARLAGEIVAADFYLRQVTFLEVLFDLSSEAMGWNAADALRELRRGDHGAMQIVSTPFADLLDRSRRLWWSQEGEPERPPHPDARFLERHSTAEGECSTYADQHSYGAITTPARGYSQEEWAKMAMNEQQAAREAQFEADAEEQIAWEQKARAEWEERQNSLSPFAGEGGGEGA